MNDQNRVAAGVPEAGQWTPGARDEADGVALGDPQAAPEGTFRYPPPFDTAEEAIAFWERCPVGDAELDRLRRHARATQTQRSDNAVRVWEIENPRPTNERDLQAWTQARNQYQSDMKRHYGSPNPSDLRTLARLNQMVESSKTGMFPNERDRMLTAEWKLPASGISGRPEELLDSLGCSGVDLSSPEQERPRDPQLDYIASLLERTLNEGIESNTRAAYNDINRYS